MRADPPDLWTSEYSSQYETANYGAGLAGSVMKRSHQLVEESFGPQVKFNTVLEVGAGSGIHAQFVKHDYDKYIMTDFSQEMLDQIKTKVPRTAFEVQDATKLNYADGSIDRLIAAHVLEHMYRPHEILREWARVVRPGGVLSLVLPCDPGFLWRFGRYFGPRQKAKKNGLAYDYVMAREHVNSITNLVSFIRYYFDDVEEKWWPARVPSSDLNLIYTANIRMPK